MKKLLTLGLAILTTIVAYAQNGYQVGQLASDFKLKNVNGKMVAMADYKDAKGYIVVFTCNTCPVAKDYQARIEALNQQFANKGYPVVAINTNDPGVSPGDSYDKMKVLAKEKKMSYAYLEDAGQKYTATYGATKTPHVFILQKTPKGNQVAYIGAIDDDQHEENPQRENYVQNAVNALLQNKKPSPSFTKAFGCTVKWKKKS